MRSNYSPCPTPLAELIMLFKNYSVTKLEADPTQDAFLNFLKSHRKHTVYCIKHSAMIIPTFESFSDISLQKVFLHFGIAKPQREDLHPKTARERVISPRV